MKPNKTKKLESNIWKYALFLITNKRVFVAILGAYYLTFPDVTEKGIGIILLVGSLAGFIFELPSGYISDRMGHKRALVASRLAMLVSTILFLTSTNIIGLILAGVLLSLANAFHSGTGSAFLYETLVGLKREKEHASISGKIGSIGFAIPIIFVVLTPFLVDINFKAPFVFALVIDVIGLFVAFMFVTPSVKQKEVEEVHLSRFSTIFSEGRATSFFLFALFSGIIAGTAIGASVFRPAYQLVLEVPVIWFGVLFGIGRAFASILLAYSGGITKKISLYGFFGFQLLIFTAMYLALGFIANKWLVVGLFIVINAFQWGLTRIDNAFLLETIKDSKFKATLLSTNALMGLLATAVTSFGLGVIIEKYTYQKGYLLFAIAFLVVLFPFYLYLRIRHKSRNVYLYDEPAK